MDISAVAPLMMLSMAPAPGADRLGGGALRDMEAPRGQKYGHHAMR
jgi:hypothetical protein